MYVSILQKLSTFNILYPYMAEINPLIVYAVLGILIVILIIWVVLLETRLRKIFRGKTGANLEEVIRELHSSVGHLKQSHGQSTEALSYLQDRVQKSIQGVNTIRFNPFQGEGQGGNQSFATAFVSGDGDGVIISSIYSRGQVRTFAKPIKNFDSPHELSEEEIKVLEELKNS